MPAPIEPIVSERESAPPKRAFLLQIAFMPRPPPVDFLPTPAPVATADRGACKTDKPDPRATSEPQTLTTPRIKCCPISLYCKLHTRVECSELCCFRPLKKESHGQIRAFPATRTWHISLRLFARPRPLQFAVFADLSFALRQLHPHPPTQSAEIPKAGPLKAAARPADFFPPQLTRGAIPHRSPASCEK